MKIRLLSVGKKMPDWVNSGFAEYAKRMPRECALELTEIEPAMRGKSGNKSISAAQANQWKEEEGKKILSHTNKEHIVALDVKGKPWSTEQLASQLENWMQIGSDLALLIGSPEGLSKACLQRANQHWSLSPLTFPHPLVRVIVAEQLYRAWTITQNHPYHRA